MEKSFNELANDHRKLYNLTNSIINRVHGMEDRRKGKRREQPLTKE